VTGISSLRNAQERTVGPDCPFLASDVTSNSGKVILHFTISLSNFNKIQLPISRAVKHMVGNSTKMSPKSL